MATASHGGSLSGRAGGDDVGEGGDGPLGGSLPRISGLDELLELPNELPRRLRGYHDAEELEFGPSDARPALDLDVIDTSWMDTNTQGPRHNYFSVNRWLIDDLAEVITTRKRAAARPHRLVKLDVGSSTSAGNVWVCPRHPRDAHAHARAPAPAQAWAHGPHANAHAHAQVFLAAPSWIGA